MLWGGVHGVVSAKACRRRRAVSGFDLVTAAGVCTAQYTPYKDFDHLCCTGPSSIIVDLSRMPVGTL